MDNMYKDCCNKEAKQKAERVGGLMVKSCKTCVHKANDDGPSDWCGMYNFNCNNYDKWEPDDKTKLKAIKAENKKLKEVIWDNIKANLCRYCELDDICCLGVNCEGGNKRTEFAARIFKKETGMDFDGETDG